MSAPLALQERTELCDLALALGPDAPTLCEGWDARDLVDHLLIRERRPVSALGNVVPRLAGLTDRAMAQGRQRSFGVQVERLRRPSPPLRLVPLLDGLMNTFELVVHHEDLRRAQPGWEPRSLPDADLDLLWSQLSRGGAFIGRRLPVPAVVRRSDTGITATVRKGPDPVVVSGPVVELVLFLFGRDQTRGLTFEGAPDAVARLRSADLGV
ncbi:TIGR03085 family metal-binding protein [Nocardioides sp.]|uniref:TIGR03085 family metal-binding protein n=1 Tax=Nocardioides sp. TaxID=35761 RepID=UPI00260DE0BF|nr:TIGR03085 family metal-binding protein [Nocardioides sp.]MDI6908853.1 TIGR03085 family metal-binding protein [Nocardioides sp.]